MQLIGLVILALYLALAPLAAEAQSVPRIGFLELTPAPPAVTPWRQGLLQGLTDLGYVEGQNVVFVNRWAEGREDQLPGLAAELLKLKVDVKALGLTIPQSVLGRADQVIE